MFVKLTEKHIPSTFEPTKWGETGRNSFHKSEQITVEFNNMYKKSVYTLTEKTDITGFGLNVKT